MKNNRFLLIASLALNVVLTCVCLYGHFSKGEENVRRVAISQEKSVAPAFQMEVNDDDIVFMGEVRLGACNWSMLLANERCKTLAFRSNTLQEENNRLDMLFKDVSPRKFFLMYGEQELLDGAEVGEISQEYERLVARLKERFPSTEIVLMTVLPMGRQGSNELNLAMTQKVNTLNIFVRSIASRYGYPCIDMSKEFVTPEGLLDPHYSTPDGFHLNYAAYVTLKERVNDFVRN
ncbi:MAG: hypothetical protein IKP27_02395 [Paludibacteraceae bacterium]|nr:hypothetical protein [Paludibacteraceae bacterium]